MERVLWYVFPTQHSTAHTEVIQVFPATQTTGTYEVLNPPSGYPPLAVVNLAVVTDSTFSTVTSVDIG